MPLVYNDELVGLFSLANRATDYTEQDVRLMENIAQHCAPIVHARLRATRHALAREAAEQERGKAEDQVRNLQKMDALGALAGGIAHDFNNILGIISGYGELALLDAAEGSKQKTHLVQVLGAVKRGGDLAEQILTFSRQEQPEKKRVDLVSIVRDAMKFLKGSLPSTIEMRQHLEIPSAPVLGNVSQIYQIVLNLCTNAKQALGGTGGVLQVSLSAVELEPGDIHCYPELTAGRHYCMSVEDSGHGITKEVLERIFDPYFTTKRPGEGTGLGLSVVHGIVAANGGAIRVYSEPGKGSLFRVMLPAFEGESRAGAPESEDVQASNAGRILLVDDEQALVESGRQMLEHLGHTVVAQTSSEEALEAFRADPEGFDLVITDLTMPKLTGIELAKEILQLRPGCPIVLATGFGENLTPERTREIGFRHLLRKPVLIRHLQDVTRDILGQRR